MSRLNKSVNNVVKEKLCTSCGACSAVCPTKAITFSETVGGHVFPDINEDLCTNCGLCLSVCPGVHFGKTLMDRMPEDPFRGTAIESYVGKATDEEIYNNSQSGGVASALALYMLESDQADAVITVVMEWGNPPRAKAQLARNRKDIIEAQKSKYCPVPILEVLRDVEKEGLERIVIIGTSCQIHGLRNIQDVAPHLGNCAVLTIGLFCTHVMACAAIDHLISESEFKKYPDYLHLNYRDKSCNGYPGDVHIRTLDNRFQVLPTIRRGRIKPHYIPARCRLCFDGVNVFSDISVGDPWNLEDVDREKGETVTVARTPIGHNIILQAIESKVISARKVPYKDVADGQSVEMMRSLWRSYVDVWKDMGRNTPDFSDRVLVKTTKNPDTSEHHRSMKFILALDNHKSREQVLNTVEKRLTPSFFRRMLRFGKKKIKRLLAN